MQFLNRLTLTGIDEANAFMEIINIIRSADEEEPDQDLEKEKQ